MYCTNCGSQIAEGQKFCTSCGTSIQDSGKTMSADKPNKESKSLEGLNGWLIIVCINMLYTLYTCLTTIYTDATQFTNGTVEKVSSIQGFAAALGVELIGNVILSIALGYLLFLFFKKKRRFPKFFVYFLVAATIFSLLDAILLNSLNFPTTEIQQSMQGLINEQYAIVARTALSAVIWGAYMKKSIRVALTFTNV